MEQPVYKGQWERGKRHGRGVMRYIQETRGRTVGGALVRGKHSGIARVYEGEFQNDLMHGYGVLYVEKAVAQALPRQNPNAARQPGHMPPPNVDPRQLLTFDGGDGKPGLFWSDWKATDAFVRENDHVYAAQNPQYLMPDGEPRMDLALEELRKEDKRKRVDRFVQFFDVDNLKVQKAGHTIPDLATAVYELASGGTWSLKEGRARFADGSEYIGAFARGKPHGVGVCTQWELKPDGSRSNKWLGKYSGQWRNGERSGKGRYESHDGIVYEGHWASHRRGGHGVQTVPPALQEALGYAVYDGQWEHDKRHGDGHMSYGEKGAYLYVGPFVLDGREGKGKIYWQGEHKRREGSRASPGSAITDDTEDDAGAESDPASPKSPRSPRSGKSKRTTTDTESDPASLKSGKSKKKSEKAGALSLFTRGSAQSGSEDFGLLLFNGRFKNDTVVATASEPGWFHLLQPPHKHGRFYYGPMNKEGVREGQGVLYDETADDNEAFMKCFNDGDRYDVEDPADPKTFDLIAYSGPWKNNLPHGDGVQHFRGAGGRRTGAGTYTGQFFNGKRHGRGIWTTGDGWIYRPIKQATVPNWENDLMHGIAIVEDAHHVHENVLYTKGHCQMPFTDMGPPNTGFDQTLVLGTVMKGMRKGAKNVSGSKGIHAPDSTLEAKKGTGVFGKAHHGQEEILPGADAVVMARDGLSQKVDEDEDLAMVREPTDLSLPEEDVLIEGGTDTNEVMNGLYFKMSGTFGLPLYKMVRPQGLLRAPFARYLYKDSKGPVWIINVSPMSDMHEVSGAGCAWVEDEDAQRPGEIKASWCVWHPGMRVMRMPPTDEESKEALAAELRKGYKPPDNIVAKGIVGFEVRGPPIISGSGLMIRHASELYGRPVYEAESGGQFLYWLRKDGSAEQGMVVEELIGPGETRGESALFEKSGHWIISKEVGDPPNGPSTLAYVEDLAVTPDQIPHGAAWHVAAVSGKSKRFEKTHKVRLKLEEWSRNNAELMVFEEEEVTTPAAVGR